MITDPADLALEEYRNSKDYPDDVHYGIWGRINRAFQDGYAKGLKASRTNDDRIFDGFRREVTRLQQEYMTINDLWRKESDSHTETIRQLDNVVSQLKGAQEQLRSAGILVDIDIPEAYRE